MKVPFRLRRRPTSAPAAALLLPSHAAVALVRLCARLGGAELPHVFAVADGFLVKLPRPVETAPPGVVRLRALAADLWVPADAELVPALLDDEAAALVRT